MTLEECINKYGYNVWLANATSPTVKQIKPTALFQDNEEFFIVWAEVTKAGGGSMLIRQVRANPKTDFVLYEETKT